MKLLLRLVLFALLLAPASADDRTRDAQGLLKAKGFFYGDITGSDTPEMEAAIRRFQIRSGIKVTGKLTPDTLAALGLAEKKPVAIAPQSAPGAAADQQLNPPAPTKPPAAKPGEPIQRAGVLPPEASRPPIPQPVAQKTVRFPKPFDPAVIEPPSPLPAPVAGAFSTMFRDTPYAAVPREVQMDIVRRAQSLMAARRFYRGPLNGVASPATSEAIFLFQDDAALRRTGRLDPDTLAEMKLLPQPARGNPLLKPFYNPNRRRDRSVSGE